MQEIHEIYEIKEIGFSLQKFFAATGFEDCVFA